MNSWQVHQCEAYGDQYDGYTISDTWAIGAIELAEDEVEDNTVILERLIDGGFIDDNAVPSDYEFTEDDNGEGFIYILDAESERPLFAIVNDSIED